MIFTSESVSAGHPDKVCDQISDAILDAALEQDKDSRVAVETLVKDNQVVIAGEITTNTQIDYDQVIEQLGSPLYIEAVNDQDEQIITKNLYYNFRTKQYKHESPDKALKVSESDMSWGRKTTVQFTFIEDRLVGWEEDKLTLNMAVKDNSKSLLKYFSLFLNIVLAVKVFSL